MPRNEKLSQRAHHFKTESLAPTTSTRIERRDADEHVRAVVDDCNGEPCLEHAAGGDQLRTLPGSAVSGDNAVHRFGVTIRTKEETKRDRRIGLHEEQALLTASAQMSGAEHKYIGSAMHDRIIGALETCCRGEMLRIQNRHDDWESDTRSRFPVVMPRMRRNAAFHSTTRTHGAHPEAPACLSAQRVCVRMPAAEFLADFKTPWESLLLIASGHDPKRAKPGARVDRAKLRQVDPHWHDLRHEGACRLLAEHVDIRTIQLMLSHADIEQTQR